MHATLAVNLSRKSAWLKVLRIAMLAPLLVGEPSAFRLADARYILRERLRGPMASIRSCSRIQ